MEKIEIMSELVFLPAHQLAQRIRERTVSSVEVLEAYLTQIGKHNTKLNAIATVNEEAAYQRARLADEALAKGEIWGSLHGVPITIKDTLETAGLRTTSSYPPLKDYIPQQDATVVARLRAAGAVIFAKSTSATLAGDYQCNSPLFGRVNNPWNLNCTAGGSSGGSAAAIATGLSPLDIGSDIAGSIRHPAHCCGVFGFKPTDRRVPTTGHIPELPGMPKYIRHMLTVGPLARSITDLSLCLSLIAGADTRQPEIPPVGLDSPMSKDLSAYRIAWTYGFGFLPISTDTRLSIQALVSRLKSAGCCIEECNPSNFDCEAALVTYSGLVSLELYASTSSLKDIFQGLWGLIKTEFYDRTQTAFQSGTPISWGGSRVIPPSLSKYAIALTERDHFIAQMDHFLDQWDVWICPVATVPAFTHRPFGKPIGVDGLSVPYLLACGAYTMIFNLTGHPVVVIPVGQSQDGLPIGIQVVGKRWRDVELLMIAEQFSEVVDVFQSPPGYSS